MSLDQIASLISDEGASLYLRAIRLYEFQVAIFYPLSFRALCAAGTEARAANQRLRTARIYAGIRFLEQIEKELRQACGSDTIPISLLAQDQRYQTIFDNVIAPNGGWMRIRHSISDRRFDDGLAKQRDSAEVAAKIVDFSYRFREMPDRGTYKGGVTTARYVVANARSYDLKRGKSTIKTRWRKFGPTAAFLYLLLIQKFPFMPPRLATKQFSERLLKQANDFSGLRSFFRAYQNVCDVLVPRGYTFEKLSLNLNCEVPPLRVAALQADVIAAFKDSLGAME